MRSSSQSSQPTCTSHYGLFVMAVLFLVLAVGVWGMRIRQARKAAAQQQQTQHAVALLIRGFLADNQLKYSAISTTSAMFGKHRMHSEARVTRAPQNLAIEYLKGDKEGLHTGFSQRWFWRQTNPSAPMQAYAALESDGAGKAARRFALLLDNYRVRWLDRGTIDGRPVEIVQMVPYHPVDGATGPGKRLAIDEETGLTLSVETFNYKMQQVMESTLSKVDFNPVITATTFEPPEKILEASKKQSWRAQEMGDQTDEVARLVGLFPPKPRYLPPGFIFDGVGLHHCDAGSEPDAALSRYTDGLNTLTVFAMKIVSTPSSNGKEQSCNFGPGTLVSRDTPSGRLIAVADLPPPTLRRVVDNTEIELGAAARP